MPTEELIAIWRSETEMQRVGVFSGHDAREQAKAFLLRCAQECDDDNIRKVKSWDELLAKEVEEDIAVDIYERENLASGEVFKW